MLSIYTRLSEIRILIVSTVSSIYNIIETQKTILKAFEYSTYLIIARMKRKRFIIFGYSINNQIEIIWIFNVDD